MVKLDESFSSRPASTAGSLTNSPASQPRRTAASPRPTLARCACALRRRAQLIKELAAVAATGSEELPAPTMPNIASFAIAHKMCQHASNASQESPTTRTYGHSSAVHEFGQCASDARRSRAHRQTCEQARANGRHWCRRARAPAGRREWNLEESNRDRSVRRRRDQKVARCSPRTKPRSRSKARTLVNSAVSPPRGRRSHQPTDR